MDRVRTGRTFPLLATALLLVYPLAGQAPPAAPQLSEGETLHYGITWRIFSAGEARIHLEKQNPAGSPPAWQATIKATSTGFVSRLYKVDDTLVSRFEGSAMCSQSLVKILHEGRRHREIRIDFQKERKLAVLKETDLANSKPARQAENAIPECVHDVVSALFHVRSRPLEVGKSFQIHINDGSQTLPITVEVQAREEVQSPAGKFRTIRLEPKVFGGTLFRRSGRMQIWLSDDPQRLLVQLRAKLFWGTINAVLSRVERK